MAKICSKDDRPDGRSATPPSTRSDPKETIRNINMMRFCVLGFCIAVVFALWVVPNFMSVPKRVFITAFLCVIGTGGIGTLYLAERDEIRKLRRKSGCCVKCGYDLRGTPDRCPECGSA